VEKIDQAVRLFFLKNNSNTIKYNIKALLVHEAYKKVAKDAYMVWGSFIASVGKG
jgi:hypothetical protein